MLPIFLEYTALAALLLGAFFAFCVLPCNEVNITFSVSVPRSYRFQWPMLSPIEQTVRIRGPVCLQLCRNAFLPPSRILKLVRSTYNTPLTTDFQKIYFTSAFSFTGNRLRWHPLPGSMRYPSKFAWQKTSSFQKDPTWPAAFPSILKLSRQRVFQPQNSLPHEATVVVCRSFYLYQWPVCPETRLCTAVRAD